MPLRNFHVTYEIITPESAEHADAAERGFVLAGDELVELPDGVCGPEAGAVKDRCALTLAEAVRLISGAVEDGGSWFVEADGRNNYHTGANERRSLHPPDDISSASYARVAQLLGRRP